MASFHSSLQREDRACCSFLDGQACNGLLECLSVTHWFGLISKNSWLRKIQSQEMDNREMMYSI